MAPTEDEVERALRTIHATLNDQSLSEWDPGRVQATITETIGSEPSLTVDDGGGVHDAAGRRVAAIRRAPTGEWIVERQNETAERANTAIPVASEAQPTGWHRWLQKLGL